MSTHNICFHGEITKIIPKLSSNTLLICSTGKQSKYCKEFSEFSHAINFMSCEVDIFVKTNSCENEILHF